MDNQLSNVAEAFSRKALEYDAFGSDHENLTYMRQKVRQHALTYLHPSDRILELNAGTGLDAVFFSQIGFHVHATDLSPGMVACIQEKIERERLNKVLTAQVCSFTDLEQAIAGPFEYVFSNMGGINCFPEPATIAGQLSHLLTPGGHVTWVVMPHTTLWELAAVFHGDFKTATRRSSSHGVIADVSGVNFTTYYFSPRQIIQAFGPQFQPVRLQGLSVFTPPADHKYFSRIHPRIYKILRIFEEHLADRPPFYQWGDFFILTMQYLPS